MDGPAPMWTAQLFAAVFAGVPAEDVDEPESLLPEDEDEEEVDDELVSVLFAGVSLLVSVDAGLDSPLTTAPARLSVR